jgi:3-oxo-5-alpha-steroid 4-dehydrogenase 3 / polyprenol reductase
LQATGLPDLSILTTVRTAVALPMFILASVKQQQCHRHLAGLQKYTLPDDGMFRYLICPHYTCECVVYVALALAGAPRGHLFNNTILCGLLWVAINLGVTGAGTRHWYGQKFGSDKVAGKWVMIPFVF